MPATRRLAIATSRSSPAINSDDALLVQFLEASGIAVAPAVWNDDNIEWSAFEAVLIRSTWDYHKHYADFLEWLARLDRIGVMTINSSGVLRWNSDKRYLLQLPALGVDIVPTQILRADDLAAASSSMRGRDLVIKPTVSASAWYNVRGVAGSTELSNAISSLPADREYMVQPFIPEIAQEGEWSLLFFDGLYSHAVCKRPAANDYRVQHEFGGSAERTTPDAETMAASQRAVAAVEALGYDGITYARIDGVRSGGRFLIMEIELIEPFLFLTGSPEASQRFADAIARRLSELC